MCNGNNDDANDSGDDNNIMFAMQLWMYMCSLALLYWIL